MDEISDSENVYKLAIETELRVLTGDAPDVQIQLLSGLAEVFGTEMELNKVYKLTSNSSIAIFTWHGCSIKVIGNPENTLSVGNTAMILNVVLHATLEERRIKAESQNTKGPVTLVVGPTDVGKSTLCRILLNYASRLGRCPLFIDLDVGQNSISIPGTIGVLTIKNPADIVAGFDDQAIQVYQFGYKSPGHNIILYFLLLKKLCQILQAGLRRANSSVKSSGVIINSCGWVRGHGYDAITLAAMTFEIDVLCVLQEEKLYLQLKRDMPACVKVIFIPKMDGVVERSRSVRIQSREARVREYFYGPTNQLQPFSFDVQFSDIQVFKVLPRPLREDIESLNTVTLSDVSLIPVSLGVNLVNQVFGVSSADNVSDDLMLTHVIGFVCITSINLVQNTVSVLSPQPGPLPKKIFLMGDIMLVNHQ